VLHVPCLYKPIAIFYMEIDRKVNVVPSRAPAHHSRAPAHHSRAPAHHSRAPAAFLCEFLCGFSVMLVCGLVTRLGGGYGVL
jgi:hypothetical protein